MKLFLDDIRRAPAGFDCVRTYEDCIFLLGTREYEFVSLDYSLGEYFTGLDVLKWMVENHRFPPKLNVHSTHSYGRAQMCSYIQTYFPKGYSFTMHASVE